MSTWRALTDLASSFDCSDAFSALVSNPLQLAPILLQNSSTSSRVSWERAYQTWMDWLIQLGSYLRILVSQQRVSRRKIIPQSMACLMTLPRAWFMARTVPIRYHSSPVRASLLSVLREAMLSRWLFFSTMKGSLMLGQGTPTRMTALHIPSGKSMPSLTLPLQTMARMAPFLERAFFLKSAMLMSLLFSSKMMSLLAVSFSLLEDLMSSYLKSICILKEGKTRSTPLGTWGERAISRSMRSFNTAFLFLLRLSQVKVNLLPDRPERMILTAICSSFITCLLISWWGNFSLSSFSHIPRGLRVPEVSRIERGLYLVMSLKVSQGTRHLRPTTVPEADWLLLVKRRKWLNSSSSQGLSLVLYILGARRVLTLSAKISTLSKLLNTPSGVSLSYSIRATPYEVNSSMGLMSFDSMTDRQQSFLSPNSFLRSSAILPLKSSKRAWSVFSLLMTLASDQSRALSLRSSLAYSSWMKEEKVSFQSSRVLRRHLISFSNMPRTLSREGERNLESSLLSSSRAESKLWVYSWRERPSQAASETLWASSKMTMLFSMMSWQLERRQESRRQLQGMRKREVKSLDCMGQKYGQNTSSRPISFMMSMSRRVLASLLFPIATTSSLSLWKKQAASSTLGSCSLIISFLIFFPSFTPFPHASTFSFPLSSPRLSLRHSCSLEAKMAMLGRQQVLASSFWTCLSCECVRDMQMTLCFTFSPLNCPSTKDSTDASRHSVLPVPVGDYSTALLPLLTASITFSMYSICTPQGSQGKYTFVFLTVIYFCSPNSLLSTMNNWADYRNCAIRLRADFIFSLKDSLLAQGDFSSDPGERCYPYSMLEPSLLPSPTLPYLLVFSLGSYFSMVRVRYESVSCSVSFQAWVLLLLVRKWLRLALETTEILRWGTDWLRMGLQWVLEAESLGSTMSRFIVQNNGNLSGLSANHMPKYKNRHSLIHCQLMIC